MKNAPASAQKGSFVLGLVVGLLLGLAIALGVALYVAKVPIPFVDKVPQRSAEADEAEAKAHKDWNPNAKLPGGTTPRAPAASGVVGAAPDSPAPAVQAAPATPPAPGAASAAAASKPVAAPAAASAAASEARSGHVFFVQAGAFTQAGDAEQQRAKLAMQGFNAKVYEKVAGERSVFRVRIGPFDEREAADALQAQVQAAGLEAAVVRTQR